MAHLSVFLRSQPCMHFNRSVLLLAIFSSLIVEEHSEILNSFFRAINILLGIKIHLVLDADFATDFDARPPEHSQRGPQFLQRKVSDRQAFHSAACKILRVV